MNINDTIKLNKILDLHNENLREANNLQKHGKIYKNTHQHITTQLKELLQEIPYKKYEVLRAIAYQIGLVIEASQADVIKDRKLLEDKKKHGI